MGKKNKKRKLLLNNFLTVFIILIFSKSVSQDLSDSSIYSYVIMKINTKGTNKVYYDKTSSFTMPDEIYINGEKKEIQALQQFNKEKNNATLIWKNPVKSCNQMFRFCGHIIEMDFSHFNISQVTDMFSMFRECYMLTSLNLSNFVNSKVENNAMAGMFMDCIALEYLNMSNFITSEITGFGHLFYNCSSLISLDISKFDTSKVNWMDFMFYGCEKLISLNLNNFDTSSLTNISYIFHDCKSLEYLDLSNFKTLRVNDMRSAFNNCISLTSLDISNFDTTSITQDKHLNDIFNNCEKLKFINFKNYKSSSYGLKKEHFQTCSNDIVICTLNDKLNQEIKGDQLIGNNIAQHWNKYKVKLYDNDKCTDECKFTTFRYEFKNQCYKKCPKYSIKKESEDNLNKYNINYEYFCKPICNKETPFEMVYEQKCVEDCDFKMILDKSCLKNYYEEEINN